MYSQSMRKISQIFVCFSESPNFIETFIDINIDKYELQFQVED